MRWRAAYALLFGMAQVVAAPVVPQNAEREAETEAKLEALRAEIATLSAARAELAAQRDEGVVALREIDTRVSGSARRLRELDAGIDTQNRLLAEREAERVVLSRTLRRKPPLATSCRNCLLISTP